MRPGRFEVQIEVPKPRTTEQRIEILRVHTDSMARNGRVLVKDAPRDTAAWNVLQVSVTLDCIVLWVCSVHRHLFSSSS